MIRNYSGTYLLGAVTVQSGFCNSRSFEAQKTRPAPHLSARQPQLLAGSRRARRLIEAILAVVNSVTDQLLWHAMPRVAVVPRSGTILRGAVHFIGEIPAVRLTVATPVQRQTGRVLAAAKGHILVARTMRLVAHVVAVREPVAPRQCVHALASRVATPVIRAALVHAVPGSVPVHPAPQQTSGTAQFPASHIREIVSTGALT